MSGRADGIARVLAEHDRWAFDYDDADDYICVQCGRVLPGNCQSDVDASKAMRKHQAAAVDEFVSSWESARIDEWIDGLTCPDGPHRGPQGPNEDLAQCPACHMPSWCMRPEGETFGLHIPDCSLPERHESYCQPGGSGHPPAAKVRG